MNFTDKATQTSAPVDVLAVLRAARDSVPAEQLLDYCAAVAAVSRLIEAAEIEALRAERDALREALEMMVEMVEMNGFGRDYAMDVARAALHPAAAQENDDA